MCFHVCKIRVNDKVRWSSYPILCSKCSEINHTSIWNGQFLEIILDPTLLLGILQRAIKIELLNNMGYHGLTGWDEHLNIYVVDRCWACPFGTLTLGRFGSSTLWSQSLRCVPSAPDVWHWAKESDMRLFSRRIFLRSMILFICTKLMWWCMNWRYGNKRYGNKRYGYRSHIMVIDAIRYKLLTWLHIISRFGRLFKHTKTSYNLKPTK
jgi:hypothetical protein